MMKLTLKLFTFLIFIFTSPKGYSDWSSTVSLTSDYLFNGVSQTRESPALQASLDWSDTSGIYMGVWGSNVDFADETNLELDLYAGYSFEVIKEVSLDIGIAHYSYHGASSSSGGDYSEAYFKFNHTNSNLKMWYAWDYFGTGAGHYIVMVDHTFSLPDKYSLYAEIDSSISLDEEKWVWEANDRSYIHGQLALLFSINKFDFSVSVHHTDLENYDDSAFVISISKLIEF